MKRKENTSNLNFSESSFGNNVSADSISDEMLKAMKYARIIGVIADKQHIPLDEAMDMFYNSPLFEIIDDGTADLICRSDIYLANEIIRMHESASKKQQLNPSIKG